MTIMKKLLATSLVILLSFLIIPCNINAEEDAQFNGSSANGLKIAHMIIDSASGRKIRDVLEYKIQGGDVIKESGEEINGLEIKYIKDATFTGYEINVNKDITIETYLGEEVYANSSTDVSAIISGAGQDIKIKGNHELTLKVISRPQVPPVLQEGQTSNEYFFVGTKGTVTIAGESNSKQMKVNFVIDADDTNDKYEHISGIVADKIRLIDSKLNSKVNNYVFVSTYAGESSTNSELIYAPLLTIINSSVKDRYQAMYQDDMDIEHGFFYMFEENASGDVIVENSSIDIKYDSDKIKKGFAFFLRGESNIKFDRSIIKFYNTKSSAFFASAKNILITNCSEVKVIDDFKINTTVEEEETHIVVRKEKRHSLFNVNELVIKDSNFDFETWDYLLDIHSIINTEEEHTGTVGYTIEPISGNMPWGDSTCYVYIEENKDSYSGKMEQKRDQSTVSDIDSGIFPCTEISVEPAPFVPVLNEPTEKVITSVYEYIAVVLKGNSRLKTRKYGSPYTFQTLTPSTGEDEFPNNSRVFKYTNSDPNNYPYSLVNWDYLEIKKPSSDNTDTRHEVLNTGIN